MKRAVAVIVSGLLALAAPAIAEEGYPSRPITMIVPFAPGGSTDVIGRVVAEGLRQVLGQPVVVENRAGAGGSMGTAAIARATPDGYTIGIGTASTLAINPAVYSNLSFDVLGDLTPVGTIADVPNIMSVNPAVAAADMASFKTLAGATPGGLSYASAGIGSVSHLLGEQYRLSSGADIVHVPYKGAGPALTDVVAGQVEILFDNLPTSLPFVRDGKLRALAVSGEARVATLPDVPTFAEVGLDEMNWMAFFALIAPKDMPDALVQKLADALAAALALPEVAERLAGQQAVLTDSSPQRLRERIETEVARMRRAATAAAISLD
ncbi:MAG TPA: tripartite tricarboxylate transporter substrate-binding protein [Rhizobiaceae bacterium]